MFWDSLEHISDIDILISKVLSLSMPIFTVIGNVPIDSYAHNEKPFSYSDFYNFIEKLEMKRGRMHTWKDIDNAKYLFFCYSNRMLDPFSNLCQNKTP
jgi:hypothetical protein